MATGTAVPPASSEFWLTTVFTAAVPSLVAYGLYWWLIRGIGVTSLNALLFAVAPTTAVAGAIIFGEPFTVFTAVGFAISAVAVATVLIAESRAG
ncbi:EamA family transporter [Agreia sp. COWG]|uniref:EamA family transporter n=1 Tax=Agreia sp. COWG TaxID=2773266 RepID=UPI001F026116|nr:EamA family transporter [Agreia sp. COWG]